ncbi:MAG: glycosyltransferase [Amphiplicatus sp.]
MAKGSILIVTRHYPPAISGGARRPSLLAAGLRERGWTVTVASPQAPEGEIGWIKTPHPAGARGEAAAAAGPAAPSLFEKIKSIARRWLYWPDADMRWALAAAEAVKRAGAAPDWIVTTSPPESAHLAGRLIRKQTGARWLAEMRDSWIDDPLREELRDSALRRTIERRMARALLSKADHIVAVSDAIAAEVEALRLRPAPPVATIGHFARDSADGERYVFAGPGPHFVHTGQFSLSHAERRLDLLLEGFAPVARALPEARLHLIGRLTPEEQARASSSPLAAQIVRHGNLPYAQTLAMQQSADGLILFQQGTAALPGKLSEYLLMTAPILVVGDGPWRARLTDISHWPLERAQEALAAPRRAPTDHMTAALDRYEAIFVSALQKPNER